MDYQKHYNKLIERAKNRRLTEYVERHHIIPRCLGGADTPENLADLLPEEHYVAHQFLVKLYPDNRKLLWALHRMSSGSYKNPRNNKLYGWIRRKASIANSGTGNPRSKLTELEVIEIYYSTEHTKELSKQYNISQPQILSIKKKKSYKLILQDITGLPGAHPSIRRIPLSDQTVRQIYLDEGPPAHFKEKYRVSITVARNIKNKKTYKSATVGLNRPGQIALYGLLPHEVFAIRNSRKSVKELANSYSTCLETIYNIKRSKTRVFTDIIT